MRVQFHRNSFECATNPYGHLAYSRRRPYTHIWFSLFIRIDVCCASFFSINGPSRIILKLWIETTTTNAAKMWRPNENEWRNGKKEYESNGKILTNATNYFIALPLAPRFFLSFFLCISMWLQAARPAYVRTILVCIGKRLPYNCYAKNEERILNRTSQRARKKERNETKRNVFGSQLMWLCKKS